MDSNQRYLEPYCLGRSQRPPVPPKTDFETCALNCRERPRNRLYEVRRKYPADSDEAGVRWANSARSCGERSRAGPIEPPGNECYGCIR